MSWRRSAEAACRRHGFPTTWVDAWSQGRAGLDGDPRDLVRDFEGWSLQRLAEIWSGQRDEPELGGRLAAALVQTYLADSASILAWRYRLAPEEWDDLVAGAAERSLRVFSERHVEAPQPYLFRTVERAVWEYLRKARREVATPDLPLAPDPAPDPERRAADRELMNAFDACWQALEPQDRQLFEALEVHGRGAREVGESLGLTANAVNVRKFRIRSRLRDCMAARTGMDNPFEEDGGT